MKNAASAVCEEFISSSSSINERPVISAGWRCPSSSSTVGATSAKIPSPSRSFSPVAVTINGTGFSECAVFGLPSGSSM